MDSQSTLVDETAVAERPASTVLTFSHDSLLNTALYVHRGDRPVYIVKTNFTGTRTEIRKVIPGSDQGMIVAARIARNDFMPDTVKFEGCKSLQRRKWLKKKTFHDPKSTAQPGAEPPKFVWKPLSLRELALFSQDNSFTPIAWFRASVKGVEAASLSLRPEAEGLLDVVLASLIIVEQRYRVKNKFAAISSSRGRGLPILPS